MNQKYEIRQNILSQQRSWDKNDLEKKSEHLFGLLETLEVFKKASRLFIYNSISGEVCTSNFIARWQDHKKLYVPVVSGQTMYFRLLSEDTRFEISSYGIKEPVGENFTDYGAVDLVIVPGVAFDRNKNRLGRGKGFYDRFLSSVSCPKVGICFDFQLISSVPHDQFDIPMDYVVTDSEIIC